MYANNFAPAFLCSHFTETFMSHAQQNCYKRSRLLVVVSITLVKKGKNSLQFIESVLTSRIFCNTASVRLLE